MDDSKVFMFPDGTSRSNIDPALLMALNNGGGFGNNGSWMWMMFMWILFPWIFNGNGFGGFGGNNNGTGFLANQLNNDAGRDLLLQAINGRADALTQLGSMLNTDINAISAAVNTVGSAVQSVGAQVGLTSQQVINSIQSGDAALSRQLCECCCENRLAIANQTSALQSSLAAHDASVRLQLSQNHADDRLDICQQTNALERQADGNTKSITDAIAAQSAMIIEKFCDLEKRELQDKISTQGDIITQLRGQLDNDRQTAQLYSAITPIQAKVNEIANKQPNTVPVQYPNLTAVNNTPYGGGFGYGFGNGFWGNGWGGSFWG